MKETIKTTEIIKGMRENIFTAAAAAHIFTAAAGFLFAKSPILGEFFPLGAAFVCAVPSDFTAASAIGAFIGYFLPAMGLGNFRYIAAVIAVVAIKLLLGFYKKTASSVVFSCSVCFLTLAVTAPVFIKQGALKLIGEIAVAVLVTFCLKVSFRAFTLRKAGLFSDELGCLLISLSFLLSGAFSYRISGVSPAVIFSVFLILCASSGKTAAGVACSVAVAFAAVLGGSPAAEYACFAFFGLAAGVFSVYGKYASALGVIAVSAVSMAQRQGGSPMLFIEVVSGAALFLLLPKNAISKIGAVFSPRPKVSIESDVKKLVKIKLSDAAKALSDVSKTAEKVSVTLSGINSPDYSSLLADIEQKACSGCKLRLYCWESRKQQTEAAVQTVINGVKNIAENCILPEEFRERCIKTEDFQNKTAEIYNEYSERIAAELHIAEIRQVVSEQFGGIQLMLKGLSEEIEKSSRFDRGAALTAAAALKNLEIFPSEAVAAIDKYGRMNLKIKTSAKGNTVFNKMQIMKTLSRALGRRFDVPQIVKAQNDVFITVCQKANYKVEVGLHQLTAAGSSMCGDSVKYFYDGQGRFIAVLSDGMGTGGAAAVDSAMACDIMSRLIKGGIGLDCALKILNSSMIFKSSGESLATLDIAVIDLFTGKAEIYKSGAAPTVIRKGGKTGSMQGVSLPIGILKDVSFDKAAVTLKQNDILLLMSDGAMCGGTDWIKRELENSGNIPAADLSENLALSARRRRTEKREDDITVLSVIIEKADK